MALENYSLDTIQAILNAFNLNNASYQVSHDTSDGTSRRVDIYYRRVCSYQEINLAFDT